MSNQIAYVTSDLHLGHANIIKYCQRPFKSVGHMNEELVLRWNATVRPGDVVYHLGDLCMGKWAGWVARLNGRKVWVQGNHDKRRQYKECATVEEFMMVTCGGKRVLMYHYPLWKESEYMSAPQHINEQLALCDVLLYGHTHDKPEPDRPGWARRVCVEDWDYRPIALETLVAGMDSRHANNTPEW